MSSQCKENQNGSVYFYVRVDLPNVEVTPHQGLTE